jgi:hypothetical protein
MARPARLSAPVRRATAAAGRSPTTPARSAARLQIDSPLGRGTRIRAELPLRWAAGVALPGVRAC